MTLKLKTVPCKTLFTAQRWKTTAGAGLRLRIDARSALTGVAFKVAKPLLPRQVKKARTIGFMRVFVAGQSGRKRYSLKLGKKGKKSPLVAGAGKPTVKLAGGGVVRHAACPSAPPSSSSRSTASRSSTAPPSAASTSCGRASRPRAARSASARRRRASAERAQRVSVTSVSWSAPTTASTRPPAGSPATARPRPPAASAATSAEVERLMRADGEGVRARRAPGR